MLFKGIIKGVLLAVFVLWMSNVDGQYVTNPSLEQMVGQMIITGFRGDGTQKSDGDFHAVCEQIKQGQIGGVILFDQDKSKMSSSGGYGKMRKHQAVTNIRNIQQVKKLSAYLQSIAPYKLFIAVDQEGGNVQRLKKVHGFLETPSAKELGRQDQQTTYDVAYDLGVRLKELGINVNFAPVLDVDVNSASPAIGLQNRSFSSSPQSVTEHARVFAWGLKDAGIIYVFKHFPGHGSAHRDSHDEIANVTSTFQNAELEPWRNLLAAEHPLAMVMMGHIVNRNFDVWPASLSSKMVQMVRDMGFEGVIISDDMDMGAITSTYSLEKAVQMAINAGVDVLIFGNKLQFEQRRGQQVNAMIVRMVKEGKIPLSRIQESYQRIMRLKSGLP